MKIQPLRNFGYEKLHKRFEDFPKPIPKPVIKLSGVPERRHSGLINWYKESRVQPVVYGYYIHSDWHLFVGIKIKF